ncbi:dTDP-4-dehydrorhamnose 3,5-epimerase [Kosakonia pseudosacchari]|uniref:dTDP-4-dehydrorhamnose 3,5-epimerase n=1 Tax=Kosakonia pseudosacchari TaxID=1646340 RepID=UPI00187E32F0|nr:dTDP-4-dehydrorhamnose 3,5-epimerase [Kosakonia pseudosacchari]QOV62494.1 dTDP-4-dehydrorhamnose 3,5-epimerase [Kosakonia pseudosacchari]
MNVIKTTIPDVLIFEPTVFGDDRGFFFERYNQKVFEKVVGRKIEFVQDNHSKSSKGVLRGLHYQLPPYSQEKLVQCVVGEIFDVAVDIRQSSPTFGQWVGVNLSAQNKRQIWIPEGFAHGFLVVSDDAECLYKTTNYYAPAFERGIRWDDSTLGINWPLEGPFNLSEKDKIQPIWNNVQFFE